MGIEVLGPLSVQGTNGIGPRDRVVLQVLVVRAGEFVPPDVLADALWGESVPASRTKVIQGCIARLRKVLGATTIETSPYGYRLVTHEDLLDVRRFEHLISRAREQLATGDPDRAAYLTTEALGLWRGHPLQDLEDWDPGRAEAQRLDGLRMDAQELRVEAKIAGGRSREVLEDVRGLVNEAPYREGRWALFATALYLSGRQSEALEVLQRARRMLLHELGLEPGHELVSLEQSILRQDPGLTTAAAVQTSGVCPYRGLLSFEAEDAEAFFGRDVETADALTRLRERGVLAVVGASGIGKSSLVRAGVVPALRQDGTRVVVTTPGTRPLDSLAELPRHGPRPVLVVDQAEESVTLSSDAAERTAYFETLATYEGPLVVVIRADRLGDLSAYPAFAGLVERGLYLLAAMSEEKLRTAIEGPARTAGLRLEGGLVDLLMGEVHGEPGALPLLSHALRQTWELREGPTLTVEGYLRTGGIRDAVAQSAETLYERLDHAQREQLRSLFLRLVMPSDDGDPVRARVPRSKVVVDPAHEALIESLVTARLVSSDEGDLQIAHEALAREWPRLRDWLDEDVEGQRVFRHLASATEAWEGLGRPESELYRGVRLAGAIDWADRTSAQLTATEHDFLTASAELSDREASAARAQLRQQKRANRRLRGALTGVAVLFVASLGAGGLAVRQTNAAQDRETEAKQAAVSADAHRLGLQSAQERDLTPALLLAVEARRLEDVPETRDRLLSALTREPKLIRHLALDDLGNIAASPDGRTYAVSSPGGGGVTSLDSRTGHVRAKYDGQFGTVTYVGRNTIAVGENWIPDLGPEQHPVKLLDARTLKPLRDQLGGQLPNSQANIALTSSPSGRWLVAQFDQVRRDNSVGRRVVMVWDLRHPAAPAFRLTEPRDLNVVGFAAGGRLLVGWGGLREVTAYDLATGRRISSKTISGRNGFEVEAGTVSESGELLAVVVDDDIVLVDARTLREIRRWHSGTDGVARPSFSPDASSLVTVSPDGSGGVVVWDTATGRERITLGEFGGSQQLHGIFGRDGRTIATASETGFNQWDLGADHGVVPTRPSKPVGRAVGLRLGTPDGTRIAYVDSAGARPHHFLTQVQDVATGKILMTAQTPKVNGINDLQWRPDGDVVVITEGDRLAFVDADSGDTTVSPALGMGHVNSARYLGSGDDLLVLNDRGGLARVDAHTMRIETTYRTPEQEVWDASTDTSGSVAFLHSPSAPYLMLDLDTGHTHRLAIKGDLWAASLSADGTRLAAAGEEGSGVFDVVKNRWATRPSAGGNTVSWSPNGRYLAATEGSTVTVMDGETGEPIGSVEAGNAAQSSVAVIFSADSSHVIIAGETGDLHTWDFHPTSWVAAACELSGRNLAHEEWNDLVGSRPYHRTCAQFD